MQKSPKLTEGFSYKKNRPKKPQHLKVSNSILFKGFKMPQFYYQHINLVERTKNRLIKRFSGKAAKIIKVKVVPDLIIVDFEKQEVIAVEVSRANQKKAKTKNYQHTDFDKLLCVRIKPKKHRIKEHLLTSL